MLYNCFSELLPFILFVMSSKTTVRHVCCYVCCCYVADDGSRDLMRVGIVFTLWIHQTHCRSSSDLHTEQLGVFEPWKHSPAPSCSMINTPFDKYIKYSKYVILSNKKINVKETEGTIKNGHSCEIVNFKNKTKTNKEKTHYDTLWTLLIFNKCYFAYICILCNDIYPIRVVFRSISCLMCFMCLFVHSGVHHMLCCVVFFVLFFFVLCLVFPMLPVSLDWPFLIVPSVFSDVSMHTVKQ